MKKAKQKFKALYTKVEDNFWGRMLLNILYGSGSGYTAVTLVMSLSFLLHQFIYDDENFSNDERIIASVTAGVVGLIVFGVTVKGNNDSYHELKSLRDDMSSLQSAIEEYDTRINNLSSSKHKVDINSFFEDTTRDYFKPFMLSKTYDDYNNRTHQYLPMVIRAINESLKDSLVGFIWSAVFYHVIGEPQKTLRDNIYEGSASIIFIIVAAFGVGLLVGVFNDAGEREINILIETIHDKSGTLLYRQEEYAKALQTFLQESHSQKEFPSELSGWLSHRRTVRSTMFWGDDSILSEPKEQTSSELQRLLEKKV